MSAHRPITGKLVIATHNAGKLREMRELLSLYGVEAVSAGELNLPEPEETGSTFAENAAIKAHATASNDNDAAEAAAMRSVFGGALPPITALKRYLGHTSCACGAMETVALIAALQEGFIPAAAGFAEPDPALGCVPMTQALPARAGNYLLNFFGFGGNYASVVIAHG